MDTLKQLLSWEIWLLATFVSAVLLFYATRWRWRRQQFFPVLLLLSLSFVGFGGSLIVSPYDFLDFPGGFLCGFGVQLASAAWRWAMVSVNESWPPAVLPSTR